MPIYNEYNTVINMPKQSLWKYCRDELVLSNNSAIFYFADYNTTDFFNYHEKITGQIGKNGTKSVEISVPLKYVRIF